jgi:predicted transglutaminase-like cysteine proteinase
MRWLVALIALCFATGCIARNGHEPDWPKVEQAQEAQVVPKDLSTWLAITSLNERINHKIRYVDDGTQYHKSEWWVANPRSNKGDCEDYALTKISEMINANLQNVNFTRIRLSVVKVTMDNGHPVTTPVYHAVAIWIDSVGNQWVLDNCCDVPFTKKQYEAGVYGVRYEWLWPS